LHIDCEQTDGRSPRDGIFDVHPVVTYPSGASWRGRLRKKGSFIPHFLPPFGERGGANMSRRQRSQRRGVAAVEAAIVLPILVVLLLGVWEAGRMIQAQLMLDNAVREGARQAASGQVTNAQVQQTVTNYLNNAGLPTTNLVVTVTDLTSPGTDASAAAALDQLQVQGTLPFKDVRWTAAVLVTSSSTNLSSTATWYSANPQSYPASATVPQGF
jgi:Flp pilus assembly protein TadG